LPEDQVALAREDLGRSFHQVGRDAGRDPRSRNLSNLGRSDVAQVENAALEFGIRKAK
jgi:hypothetical protein